MTGGGEGRGLWWSQSHLVSELLSPLTLDWMSLAVSLPTLPDTPPDIPHHPWLVSSTNIVIDLTSHPGN